MGAERERYRRIAEGKDEFSVSYSYTDSCCSDSSRHSVDLTIGQTLTDRSYLPPIPGSEASQHGGKTSKKDICPHQSAFKAKPGIGMSFGRTWKPHGTAAPAPVPRRPA